MLKATVKNAQRLVASTSILVVSFSAGASAQSIEDDSQFGVQLHVSEVSTRVSDVWNDNTALFVMEDEEIGFGISVSYYFDPTVSVRATYERASGFQSTHERLNPVDETIVLDLPSANTEHLSLVVMPQFDISSSLYGFANVGIARTEFSASGYSEKATDTSIVYGLGFGYRVSERVRLSGEYTRTGAEYDALRLSIGYRF